MTLISAGGTVYNYYMLKKVDTDKY